MLDEGLKNDVLGFGMDNPSDPVKRQSTSVFVGIVQGKLGQDWDVFIVYFCL